MMNKKINNQICFLKYLLFIPLCALTILTIRASERAANNSNQHSPKVWQDTIRTNPDKLQSDEKVYKLVDKAPQFPGGNMEMMTFLSQNIKYPAEAIAQGIQGRVLVQFVVSWEGKVRNIKVIRGVDPLLNKEAVRLVSIMPQWIPGQVKGEAVSSEFMIPIEFRLP